MKRATNESTGESQFIATVLKLRPDFGFVKGFFYIKPVGSILSGFVFERAKYSSYMWRYALPLYDKLEFLHLAFGERFGNLKTVKLSPSVIDSQAAEFVARLADYDLDTRKWSEPIAFLAHFGRADILRNPWVKRGIALTQVMLESYETASSDLQDLLAVSSIDEIPNFRGDVDEVYRALIKDHPLARQLLLERQRETKVRYGLM